MDAILRLKLHMQSCEGAEIRRISVPRAAAWADVLKKANELFHTEMTEASYYDADGDRVVISSQEEWEECLAVCQGVPLQLHLQPLQGAPTPAWQQTRDGLKAMDEQQYDRALRFFQRAGPSPVNLYNIACCHSRLGDPAQALAKLREAVAAGYVDWRHMQSDTDLLPLQDNEEFRQLIQQMQGAAGAGPHCRRFHPRGPCRGGAAGFWRGWKGRMIRRQAEACMQQKDFSAALTFWSYARALHQDPDILRRQAGCRAALGDVAGAMADLEAAVAAGDTDVVAILADPLLEPLHGEDAFRKLVDGLLSAGDQGTRKASSVPDTQSGFSPLGADCATALAAEMLPQLTAAVEAFGPQVIAAVQMLSPELGTAARTMLDTLMRSVPRPPQPPADPVMESGTATKGDAERVLEEALVQMNLKDSQEAETTAAAASTESQTSGNILAATTPDSPVEIIVVDSTTEVPAAAAPEPQPTGTVAMDVDQPSAPAPPAAVAPPVAPSPSATTDPEMETLLMRLHELGFIDDQRNRQVLSDSGKSLVVALNRLLE